MTLDEALKNEAVFGLLFADFIERGGSLDELVEDNLNLSFGDVFESLSSWLTQNDIEVLMTGDEINKIISCVFVFSSLKQMERDGKAVCNDGKWILTDKGKEEDCPN